jgi:hypothetical protein
MTLQRARVGLSVSECANEPRELDGVTEVDCMSSVANHRDVHVGAHLALHLAYSLGRRKRRVTSKERLAVHSTCGRKPLHSTDFSFSLPRV